MPKTDPASSTAAEPVPKRSLASQTLFRGLEIVDAVSQGFTTLPEISKQTGISYSTAHRLASALTEIRYLQHEPRKGYSLGSRLIELGFQAHRQSDILGCARPYLERLAAQTRDTVHLATLIGDEVVYLDKLAGQRAVEISSHIGGRKPVCTTGVGKALLIDSGEPEWRRLYTREAAKAPQMPPEAVWIDAMRGYAQADYAFDLGEDEPSIRCVAAPIRDATNRIVAAVSVSSAVQYMDSERVQALIPVIRRAAADISQQLGGKPARP
ncbi:IclR family transcriptional regulator [Cupriavidus basilensis]|uniref:IclR family transcriptional regulator n=1 Tax=Cupriavidus basilensis TaxID=68895 RepID=A0ABT6AL09_9BURK|nr:IclR family transcriptional regulator [Cupriavidus basilensis]MDF3833139.1 IclR family transcriptional regulator [Cupriavidus basilensis]